MAKAFFRSIVGRCRPLAALSILALLVCGVPALLRAQDARTLRRIKLERATVIDGILCAANSRPLTFLYPSGRLESCALATDTTWFGHQLPAESYISLLENGEPKHIWLSRDTRLQGILCKGTGRGGWSTALYPSGRLQLCFLPQETVIEQVPCRKGSFWGEVTGGVSVVFHESGKLRSCSAARAFTLGGRNYKARERVTLAEGLLP